MALCSRNSGNERAADASAALGGLLLPYRLQVDANRRENRDVQDGKQILRNFFLGIELNGHAPKTQVENTRALPSWFAKDGIRICASHGDPFGFALNREHARGRGNHLRRRGSGADGSLGLATVFLFFRRALRFDGNRGRQRAGNLRGRSGSGNRYFRWRSFRALCAVDRPSVVFVLLAVKTLVRNADELIGLLRVLRKDRDAVIHADGNFELERPEHLGKNRFHAAAEGQSLLRIRLRQEQSEFVAADAKSRVGSTQRLLKRRRGGAQNFVPARMAVLVVHFLETMQVQDNQAERMRVAASAIQFFFEGFSKEPAIVKNRQRIGDGIYFKSLEIFMLDDDGHAKEAG